VKLKLDAAKCTGCKICELACSATHQGVFNPAKSHIKINTVDMNMIGEKQLKSCTLCLSCVSICPSGAITFNGSWLVVDYKSCAGCGMCVDHCPQEIIYLDASGKAAVPDFCKGSPSCVEWCPHRALNYEEAAK
jgi:anaerobic carbon-monoxide dehydrogenase iron sulfur subunit